MSTDPTDLREQIENAILNERHWSHLHLTNAVLTVVEPYVREQQAKAWEQGHSWGWADYEDHAAALTLDLADMPSRADAATMSNPYRKEQA